MKKRLGIFVFYDRHGIVDDYVCYLLEEMKKCADELIAISNGYLKESELNTLKKYASQVFQRENRGMDAAALKAIFTQLCTADYFNQFDELFWFNDTCYGPLYPMTDIFDEMNQRGSYDFWGLTVHAQSNANWGGGRRKGIPEHLQSYFIVVKRSMFMDSRFYDYWKQMEISDNFNDVVANYELSLTSYFHSLGYQYGVFCDTRSKDDNPDFVSNLTAYYMVQLVSQYRFPFLKRKNFLSSKTAQRIQSHGENAFRVLEYVRSHQLYPVDLIYKNLVRLYPQEQFKDNLELHFVPSSFSEVMVNQKALIVLRVDHAETLRELPADFLNETDLYEVVLLTSSDDLFGELSKKEGCLVFKTEEKDDISSMIQSIHHHGLNHYSYYCLLSEEYGLPANQLCIKEQSNRYLMYRHLIASENHIAQVMNYLENHSFVGLMCPYFTYAEEVMDLVRTDFHEKITKTAEVFGSFVPSSKDEVPFSVSSSFWCRKDVLNQFTEEKMTLFSQASREVQKRSMAYIAQSGGYATALISDSASCVMTSSNLVDTVLSQSHFNSKRRRKKLKKYTEMRKVYFGAMDIRDSSVTKSQLVWMIFETALFYLKKKTIFPISKYERQMHVLGTRDLMELFQQMK